MPPFVLIFTISLSVIVMLVVWAACLRFGLGNVGVTDVGWKRPLLISLAVYAFNLLLAFGANRLSDALPIDLSELPVAVAQLVLSVFATCLAIAMFFRVPPWHAIVAWAPTLAVPIASMLFLAFVWRPYLFEGFLAPTMSMAPTLLGPHVVTTCPECGAPAYATAHNPLASRRAPEVVPTICQAHFHNAQGTYGGAPEFPADRFIVTKWLQPRRWDLVTFRVPFAPEEHYVKRIVGLPGETIVIKDGAIWANGVRLDPPAEITELKYASSLKDYPLEMWGTEDRPATLGDDEYFVLGDFTSAAADSRMWQDGATGHSPYAVPASHIIGVVTHIYWPPSRIRTFEQYAELPPP